MAICMEVSLVLNLAIQSGLAHMRLHIGKCNNNES